MNILTSAFLGLVQGVAEFLPISSSGHLSLFQAFFGLTSAEQSSLFFDVLLHLGTLVAVCFYYRKDILALLKEFVKVMGCLVSKQKRNELKEISPDGRMILMILVATLPLLVVYPIKDYVERLYGNTLFIGAALIVTGILLFTADRRGRGRKGPKTATMKDAVLVGFAQAIAVVPGLSRSGTSISAGMMCGFSRKFAVRFSFLMSIPAVLGANILSLKDAVEAGIQPGMLPVYLVGVAIAAVSGYFAIRLVNMLTDKGRFGSFAYYCWGIGAAAVVATLVF